MPELSIVIPTLRRIPTLRQTLACLERQDGAGERFEVIVAADAAEPDFAGVEAAVRARSYPARALQATTAGTSAARNAGCRVAAAALVLFLGDDILAEPGLVAQHLAWHERHPEAEVAVLGDVRWADTLPRTIFMRWLDMHAWQFDYEAIRAAGAGADVGWGRFYTANVSLKRELIERSGGFDESFTFGEDIELARRLRDLGLRLLYDPAARAEHLHEPSLDAWRERVKLAARAEQRLVQKYPDVAPYFLPRMREALDRPPPRGLGARLAPLVRPETPWLGAKVWGSVDARYRRELAPAFVEAWEQAERELPEQSLWERSRARWRTAAPDARLTWSVELTGDAFVERAAAHGVFGPGRTVVEIGPGYGRLLRSALAAGAEFERWIGVDLSGDNVTHLRATVSDPRCEFVHGDAESVRLDARADALISSLTFKHFYPTFEKALDNLAEQLNDGAIVAIDLIEGERGYFEPDGVTWVRWYTRAEVETLFARARLQLSAFDEVRHDPELVRLFAVGVKR